MKKYKCKLRAVYEWLTTPSIWFSWLTGIPIVISGHIVSEPENYVKDGQLWERTQCVDCGHIDEYPHA